MGYYPEFSRLIDEELVRQDRSPSWLAQRLGVSPSTVSRWLNQGVRPRDSETVVRVADILGLASRRRELLIAAGYGYQDQPLVEDDAVATNVTDKAKARPPHNLPSQLTPLFGRDREHTEVCRMLVDPDIRLVTIVGAGGMGKTRLAQEAGLSQLGVFTDGVFFVPLARLVRSRDMVTAIAEVLDLSFQPDDRSPRQQILDHLRQQRMLLVLDNCEHLLDGINLVHEMLEASPNLVVLATSRERLHLTGETVFALDGIDCVGSVGTPSPSVRLFLYGAGLTLGDQPSAHYDVEQISRICDIVRGMPLGILLAATWTILLSPGEIAGQIERSLDFLESELRDLPGRQRSMRAVFDHSWSLLSADEKAVYARLSIFQGGFDLEAGRHVGHASLRQLMSLMDKSLLIRTGSGRYEVHELLRQFAAEQLTISPDERVSTRDHHSEFYLGWLEGLTPDLYGRRQQAVLEQMEVDRENVRLAWEWAVTRGNSDRLAGALTSMGHYFEWYGRFREGIDSFRQAEEQLTNGNSPLGRRARVRLLAWQASYQRVLGRGQVAARLLAQADALIAEASLSEEDTRREQMAVLWERARLVYISNADEAASIAQESAALAEQIGDAVGLARTLYLMGENAMRSYQLADAEALFMRSLGAYRDLGNPKDIAFSLSKLGYVMMSQGRFDEAEPLIREGYDLFMAVGDRSSRARALRDLAGTYWVRGRYERAEALYEQSHQLYEELGDRQHMMETTVHLLNQKVALGNYDEVRNESSVGLAMARDLAYHWAIGWHLGFLGQVALVRGDAAAAQGLLDEAVKGYADAGLPLQHRQQAYLSLVSRSLGESAQARAHLALAVDAILGEKNIFSRLQALPVMALYEADSGNPVKAVELDALARRYPMIAHSRWWSAMAFDELAARAESLPAEQVAEAKKRGQSLDIKEAAADLLAELSVDAE